LLSLFKDTVMALILAIGFIAAAIAGGLIEYLLERFLPDKPKLKHTAAVLVAFLIFVSIAVWSALREDSNNQDSNGPAVEELRAAGAFVEIESIDPSPDETILISGKSATVVVNVKYYLPSTAISPQVELHYLTAYQSEERHSSWHIIHTVPAEVGTHHAKLAGTVNPPDRSALSGEPFQIGVALDILDSEKGQMSEVAEDTVIFPLTSGPTDIPTLPQDLAVTPVPTHEPTGTPKPSPVATVTTAPTVVPAPTSSDARAPTPEQTEIVVDDLDSGFSRYGTERYWREANIGHAGHMWWTLGCDSLFNWAKWCPQLQVAGLYRVYVYIPRDNATTEKATYIIQFKGGEKEVVVNQAKEFNEWVELWPEPLPFDSVSTQCVTLADNTGEGLKRQIGFDAVKWVWEPGQ
jgi:hypothetical protein